MKVTENFEEVIKFGEINFSNICENGNWEFQFVCTFCQQSFQKSFSFIEHVIKSHHIVNLEADIIKESFCINKAEFDSKINKNIFEKEFPLQLGTENDFKISETNSSEISNCKKNEKPSDSSPDCDENLPNKYHHDNLMESNTKNHSKLKKITKKKRTRLLNGESNWQCPICNVVLKCTSKYDHLKRHGGQLSFKCSHCDEVFTTKVRKRNHEKQHTGEEDRPIECTINDCTKRFKSKVILKNHIRRDHLGIREHKCNFCDKYFYLKVERISHERANHTKEKPCICEICGLSFRIQQKLNVHMQNHDEPKFNCDKCDKKFHAKANWKRHQICHSNLKPFACEICSASFPRLCAYKQHLKLHSNIKEYVCKLCDKDYYDISGMSCHMKSAHGLQYNKINVIKRSQIKN